MNTRDTNNIGYKIQKRDKQNNITVVYPIRNGHFKMADCTSSSGKSLAGESGKNEIYVGSKKSSVIRDTTIT